MMPTTTMPTTMMTMMLMIVAIITSRTRADDGALHREPPVPISAATVRATPSTHGDAALPQRQSDGDCQLSHNTT
jgi:hypothetical protein